MIRLARARPGLRRGRWAGGALCLWGLLAPAHALDLRPVTAGLDATHAQASSVLLADTAARLPAQWASAIDRPVTLQWREDLPAGVHGRAYPGRIELRRALLADLVRHPEGTREKDEALRAARAAILHELAHLYDRSAAGGLSRDPRLLDLAGWQVRPVRAAGRVTRNAFSDRSPDRYELSRPAEFVAVNLEHFILDPEYTCRRPALHRYFAQRLQADPASAACAPGQVYAQADADAPDDASALLHIDPARVYAVDYLLAEPDRQVMSRWGHGMLRLVVCAPGRAPGPDCRLDLAHHQVLSFRAFVDDVQISSWRGLTGSYPSRLFVLPLDQVIDEYTKVELRGLRSVPLRLSRTEIEALLERAAQVHWSYDGRYYFVSNNCAVETYKLLHDGVPRLARESLASITPTGLLRRLDREGVADSSVLGDAARAQRLGYRFEALSAHYQSMFDVARATLDLPVTAVRDWLDLPGQTRSRWMERADLRAGAALLLLEHAALRREESRARSELKRRVLGRASARHQDDLLLSSAREALQRAENLTRPAAWLHTGGYGLPQQRERDELTNEGAQYLAQWRESSSRLRHEARNALPESRQASLRATESNIELLGARLRELHQLEGGFRLP